MTRKELEYLDRLRTRAAILRSRVDQATYRAHYIIEWEMELHAVEWAIKQIESFKLEKV